MADAQAAELAPPQTYSLTPQQRADLLNASSRDPSKSPITEDLGDGSSRQIHGEVGVMIGTGGERGMFGTAAIPLGSDAGAVISFESNRFRDRRYR